ncbi:hypothetical protein V8B97DRAFT_1919425 [Scleroderma yunnanense]
MQAWALKAQGVHVGDIDGTIPHPNVSSAQLGESSIVENVKKPGNEPKDVRMCRKKLWKPPDSPEYAGGGHMRDIKSKPNMDRDGMLEKLVSMNVQTVKEKGIYLCHQGHPSNLQSVPMESLGVDSDTEDSELKLQTSVECKIVEKPTWDVCKSHSHAETTQNVPVGSWMNQNCS